MVKYTYPLPNNIKFKKHTGQHHEEFTVSRFAIDFIVPLGTPVLAARSGKVISVKKDSKKFLSDIKKIKKMKPEQLDKFVEKYTNYVCIAHSDGSFAEYCHLDTNVQVKESQKVEVGEVIGYCGMTGLTTQPHLHFNVFIVKNGKAQSIPIEFKN